MLPRFFVPDLGAAKVVSLPTDEAHHLVKVLRLQAGDLVHVFDGRGIEWRGRVESAGRNGATVTLLEPVTPHTPPVDLTLVQAVLKGDAMDDIIRDCTMVGVRAVQPILTERTTVRTSAMTNARERWQRIAVASAKQCGAARLPEIREVVGFNHWVAAPSIQPAFILVEPSLARASTTMRELASHPIPSEATLIVGPEGGWTEQERDCVVAARCTPLSLGRTTLRARTVPLVAAAALLAIWDR